MIALGLRRNAVYSTAGMLVRLSTALVAAPFLIRALGLEVYGQWVVLVSLTAIAGLALAGLDSALTYYLAAANARRDVPAMEVAAGTALLLVTGLGLTVTVFFELAVPWLVNLAFPGQDGSPTLTWSLRLLGLSLLPRFWQQWAVAIEAGLLRYDWQAQIETINGLVLNAGLIGLALAGHGILALVGWTVVTSVITLVAHGLRLRQTGLSPRRDRTGAVAPALVGFGATQWISNVGGVLFTQVDRILVSVLLGPAMAGLYAAITSVTSRINELSAAPIQSIAPAISAAVSSGHTEHAAHVFRRAVRLNGVAVYLLSIGLFIWAWPIAEWLVSPTHAVDGVRLLYICIPIYALYSLNAPGYFTVLGLREPWVNAIGASAGGIATLLLMVLLMPDWGVAGAAWGNSGYLLTMAINIPAAYGTGLGLRGWLKETLPFGVSSLAAGSVVLVSVAAGGTAWWFRLMLSTVALLPMIWIDPQSVSEVAHRARHLLDRRRQHRRI